MPDRMLSAHNCRWTTNQCSYTKYTMKFSLHMDVMKHSNVIECSLNYINLTFSIRLEEYLE